MQHTTLAASLYDYQPSDAEEASHLAAIRVLTEETADPFDRRLYAPGHLTASAFVVSRDAGKALLIFHRKLNRWLQPGGHVEPKDEGDAEAAARREVREETGLIVAASGGGLFDLDVHAIPARPNEPEHLHHDLRYLFFVDGLPTSPEAELTAHWFTAGELLAMNPDAGMRRMIAKAQERSLL